MAQMLYRTHRRVHRLGRTPRRASRLLASRRLRSRRHGRAPRDDAARRAARPLARRPRRGARLSRRVRAPRHGAVARPRRGDPGLRADDLCPGPARGGVAAARARAVRPGRRAPPHVRCRGGGISARHARVRLRVTVAAFRVRSFRSQWSADLLTSWASEMEAVILGWYVITQTGSVLLLTVFGSLQFFGTLAAPMFGVLSDRLGGRVLLCAMRAIYATLGALVMVLAVTGWLTPAW